jgi:hypothetical protein
VITAPEYFDVGPTSQGRFYADQHVRFAYFGYGYLLYFQVFFAVEYGSLHLRFHL